MDIITSYRKINKLSQGQLAEKAGLYQMQISRAERLLRAGKGVDPNVARALSNITNGDIPLLQLIFPDTHKIIGAP